MAFVGSTWLLIFISSVTTSVFLMKIQPRNLLPDVRILLPLYILLEQGCIDTNLRKLSEFRACVFWLELFNQIFYKGDNITSLIVPYQDTN